MPVERTVGNRNWFRKPSTDNESDLDISGKILDKISDLQLKMVNFPVIPNI